MDIICAKCGKHFSGIEAAREHRGHCKETSNGEPIRWIPAPKSKITPEEWESLIKLITPKDVSPPKAPSDVEPIAVASASSKEPAEPDVSMPSDSQSGKRIPDKKKPVKKKREKKSNYKIPNWLIALLFIFALCIIGLGVSVFAGVFIPFWILFIFSLIYSIEKWFYYPTRKHKLIGNLYKLLLNLSILSLFSLIIWSAIKLFSQQFLQTPLIGSLVFLAEFGLFIWIWRVISKNSWRWPSIKLTVFSLICLFVIFAFAGVQPISSYKDNFLDGWSNTFNIGNDDTSVPVVPISPIPAPELPVVVPISPIPAPEPPVVTPMQTIVQDNIINNKTGEYKDFYLGLVYLSSGSPLGGNGCYDDEGEFIVLINNKNAKNPNYSELLTFLRSDDTEQFSYQVGLPVVSFYYGPAESNVNLDRIRDIIDGNIQPDPPKVCGDFAERLHNNAEKAGIRCGYALGTMHAFNVFETTDKGLVYIDDTGTSGTIMNFDCQAFLDTSSKVRLQPLFPEDRVKIASITYVGGDVYYEETIWDGEWK